MPKDEPEKSTFQGVPYDQLISDAARAEELIPIDELEDYANAQRQNPTPPHA